MKQDGILRERMPALDSTGGTEKNDLLYTAMLPRKHLSDDAIQDGTPEKQNSVLQWGDSGGVTAGFRGREEVVESGGVGFCIAGDKRGESIGEGGGGRARRGGQGENEGDGDGDADTAVKGEWRGLLAGFNEVEEEVGAGAEEDGEAREEETARHGGGVWLRCGGGGRRQSSGGGGGGGING